MEAKKTTSSFMVVFVGSGHYLMRCLGGRSMVHAVPTSNRRDYLGWRVG